MALTLSVVKQSVFGDQRIVIADVTFDNSYPTGGEVVDLAALGLIEVNFAQTSNKAGYIVEYDYANKKLIARLPAAAHTHTENTDAEYTQNATTAASTAAVAGEVSNGTNLSTLTVRVMLIGF